MGQRRGHAAQPLIDPLDMLPGAAMFVVSIELLLPGFLPASIEWALLHFQKPVHGLFGHFRTDIWCAVHRWGHKAK